MELSGLQRDILETLREHGIPVRADLLRTMIPVKWRGSVQDARVMVLHLRPLIAEGWVSSRDHGTKYKEYFITKTGAAYLDGRGIDREGRAKVAQDIIDAYRALQDAPPSLAAKDRAERAWQASLAPLLGAGYPLTTQSPHTVLAWCYGVLIQT